jgi:hypothetical protein
MLRTTFRTGAHFPRQQLQPLAYDALAPIYTPPSGIDQFISSLKLRWAGQVMRMDDEAPLHDHEIVGRRTPVQRAAAALLRARPNSRAQRDRRACQRLPAAVSRAEYPTGLHWRWRWAALALALRPKRQRSVGSDDLIFFNNSYFMSPDLQPEGVRA